MEIKKKVISVAKHVRNHQALYAYVAGVAVATVTLTAYFNHQKLIDLQAAAKHIEQKGLAGLYYTLKDEKYILFKAPEDFKPVL